MTPGARRALALLAVAAIVASCSGLSPTVAEIKAADDYHDRAMRALGEQGAELETSLVDRLLALGSDLDVRIATARQLATIAASNPAVRGQLETAVGEMERVLIDLASALSAAGIEVR